MFVAILPLPLSLSLAGGLAVLCAEFISLLAINLWIKQRNVNVNVYECIRFIRLKPNPTDRSLIPGELMPNVYAR